MQKSTISLNSCLHISLISIGLLFLVPFINLYHTYPIVTFYTEWLAALFGIAATVSLLHPATLAHLRIPRVSLVFLGLAMIVAVQWVLGMLHSSQHALLTMSYLIWAFLLTIIGSQLRVKFGWEKLTSTFAWFLVIAGIINAGIIVLQVVVHTGGAIAFLPNFTNYGAINQPNHFANFIALTIVSLIYLFIKERFSITFFTLILLWFLTAFSFSGSRSTWLYLMAIVVLAFILHRGALKNNTTSFRSIHLLHITLLVLPLFALVQLLIYYFAPDGLVLSTTARLTELAANDTPSARLHIWYDSLRLFLQSPWLGTGVGTMQMQTFLLLDTPAAMATRHMFEHAHNLFLHLLAEMGIFALCIVCAGLALWIKTFKWHALSLETWWLIALLSVLGIHSMLEYPLWFAYFLGIASVLLGAGDEKLISINTHTQSKVFQSKLKTTLLATLLTMLCIAGVVNLASLLIANFKLEKSLFQSKNTIKNQQQDLDWVKRYSLLSPYAELIQAIKLEIDSSELQNQFLLNQSALRFRPLRKIAYQHVLLLEQQGDRLGAIKLLKRTQIVYPYKTKYLEAYIPAQYQQTFLTILSEATPESKP